MQTLIKSFCKRNISKIHYSNENHTLRQFSSFYDSQSGGFITMPGSQGLRLHDKWFSAQNNFKNKDTIAEELWEYMQKASEKGITSLSLPPITDLQAFRENLTNIEQFIHKNLPLQVVTEVWNTEQARVFAEHARSTDKQDILQAEASALLDGNTKKNEQMGYLRHLADFGVHTRANLFLPLDSIIEGADMMSVIEVGDVLAGLADRGVKVINLGLCTTNSSQMQGLDEDACSRVQDYLTEILEEGLNLDVSGDPLLERLSLQCPSTRLLPGVADLARSLGISRLTISGMASAATSNSTESSTLAVRGHEGVGALVTDLNDPAIQATIQHFASK